MRLLVILFILLPTSAMAAYQNPTVESKQILPDGSTQITLRFTGDDNEPIVERTFRLTDETKAEDVQRFIGRELKRLNDSRSSRTDFDAIGKTIPPLPPNPEREKSAKQVWRDKYERYQQYKNSGLGGAVEADLDELKADLETTYKKGFLND